MVVDQLLSEPFSADFSGDQNSVPELTAVIRKLVTRAGVSGSDVIAGVGRSHIELRSLQLPQADENDLPDMVRFTAMRLFASVGDSWPIDFVTLPKATGKQTESPAVATSANPSPSKDGASATTVTPTDLLEVLAVAINPATVSQIRRVCSDAGLNLVQLGLRPMASGTLATLGTYSPVSNESTVLLIDILTDEAEMVVLEQGRVTFMRSVRLAPSEGAATPSLSVGEIRRTLIAAVNARPSLKVEKIVLWTNPLKAESTIADWKKSIDLPSKQSIRYRWLRSLQNRSSKRKMTPADLLRSSDSPYKSVPLNKPFRPQPSSISFTHAKGSKRKSQSERNALAGIAAGLLILGSLWWYRSTHLALDSEIDMLSNKLKSMEETLKLAQKNSADWKKVERFMASDIQWLDQLVYLSQKALPPEQMVMVTP